MRIIICFGIIMLFLITACTPLINQEQHDIIVQTAGVEENILEAWDFEEGSGAVAEGYFGNVNITVSGSIWQSTGYCVDGDCIWATESDNAEMQIASTGEHLNPGNYQEWTLCVALTYHEIDGSENDNVFSHGNNNRYQLDHYFDHPDWRGRFDDSGGSSCNAATSDHGMSVNTTYKVCAGHNYTHNFIYRNGMLVDSTSCGATLRYNVSGETFRLGEGPFNGGDIWATYDSVVILDDSPVDAAPWYNSTGYQASGWSAAADSCDLSAACGPVDCSDACTISSAGTCTNSDTLTFTGLGTIMLSAYIDVADAAIASGCEVAVADGGFQ